MGPAEVMPALSHGWWKGWRGPKPLTADFGDRGRGFNAYRLSVISRVRRALEVALRERRITPAESGRLMRRYEESLEGYTYLTGD